MSQSCERGTVIAVNTCIEILEYHFFFSTVSTVQNILRVLFVLPAVLAYQAG